MLAGVLMAEMIKAIKLTPRGPNVHLKLSDVLSQGSIILGFPSLSDEQVKQNLDNIRKLLSSQTTTDKIQGPGSIKAQLVDVQIKKSKHEQLKEAVDKFNSEVGAEGNVTYEVVNIFTTSWAHILAVNDTPDSNNRYSVYFKSNTNEDDDGDLSTVFVKLTGYDPSTQTAVTMFINFIDHTTALPMGTIPQDNRLYAYDPLNDSNDPPPTGYYLLLCHLTQKLTQEINVADRFLFKIGSIPEEGPIYPILNSSDQRICKDDTDNYAVIKESTTFELTIAAASHGGNT